MITQERKVLIECVYTFLGMALGFNSMPMFNFQKSHRRRKPKNDQEKYNDPKFHTADAMFEFIPNKRNEDKNHE